MLWRRSFDTPPPALADDDQYSQVGHPQYDGLGDELPRSECLKDVIARLLPYWESDVVADLKAGHTVLVAAHGNSLRALIKHLDNISDQDITEFNIPTGAPRIYEFDASLNMVRGEYLGDAEAIAKAAKAVAEQASAGAG